MESSSSHNIEVVRGRLEGERADEVLAFWAANAGLEGESARERLPEVICVLRDADERVVGVNSAYPERVGPVGNRRFWIYRTFVLSEGAAASRNMVSAAFDALEDDFDPDAGGPVGLCLLVEDREEMRRRPEAEWSDPRLLYAGYAPDGRQIRIAYFEGARVGAHA
jgi:hypothetical protein